MLVFSTLLLGALNGLVVLLGSVGMAPAWLAMWALSRGSLLGEALLSVIIWVWSRRFPTKPAGVFSERQARPAPQAGQREAVAGAVARARRTLPRCVGSGRAKHHPLPPSPR